MIVFDEILIEMSHKRVEKHHMLWQPPNAMHRPCKMGPQSVYPVNAEYQRKE